MLSPIEIERGRKYLSSRVPFPDPDLSPLARAIAESYFDIRAEAESLMRDNVWSPYFASDTYTGEWDLFWFKANGEPDRANCVRCPRTAALIARFPEIRYAAFSALVPNTHIPPHEGIPGVVRVHMGLTAEDGQAGWKCGGEERPCVPGRVILFEDGFEHEAWNWGKFPRITLMLTIASPGLTRFEAEEVFRIHDKKYGFYYVFEKIAKASGPLGRALFRALAPLIQRVEPLVNRAIFHLKPVFILFMSRWAKKKSLETASNP